jgi:hypothetical protein
MSVCQRNGGDKPRSQAISASASGCKLLWLAAGWMSTIRRLLRNGKALRPQHLDLVGSVHPALLRGLFLPNLTRYDRTRTSVIVGNRTRGACARRGSSRTLRTVESAGDRALRTLGNRVRRSGAANW